MDDPVDLMPQVTGRTHVAEWEDIPAKNDQTSLLIKNSHTSISLFLTRVDKEDNIMKP
jgi:hypothetical protein